MTVENLVYIVDDDPAVLNSVEALLSPHHYLVRSYASAADFLGEANLDTAGCLISDVQMPGINGAELLQRLNSCHSPLSMVVVTGVADVPMAVALMEGGAITLLEKPYDQTVLLNAITRGLESSRERLEKQRSHKSVQERLDTLSEEERAVMDLMLKGEPNKAIASRLQLSMRTVDRRRQSVLQKMHVDSLPELAMLLGGNRV